jgi:hypothetical protein
MPTYPNQDRSDIPLPLPLPSHLRRDFAQLLPSLGVDHGCGCSALELELHPALLMDSGCWQGRVALGTILFYSPFGSTERGGNCDVCVDIGHTYISGILRLFSPPHCSNLHKTRSKDSDERK